MTSAVLVLLVVAVLAFAWAARALWSARLAADALVPLGLASLTLAILLSVGMPPPEPEPPDPPVTGDFGGYRPHYQGHGTKTPGGRGGEIRRVRTAGELQQAVQARPGCADTPQTCARVIIFDASGNYDVGGQLAITSPYLTMAGQTAPDDGVTIINTRFLVDTHDVVVQHVKVRRPPRSLNACSIGDAGDGGDNSHVWNVVFDHITCTWAEEVNNFLMAGPGSHDVSVLDSLIAEALWPGALGGIGAGIGYRSTIARTLFSQQWSRQPIWGSPGELAIYNSVSYNGTNNQYGADTLPAFMGDADGDGSPGALEQTVIVNNVLIPGPNSGTVPALLGLSKKADSIAAGAKIYLSGNQGPGVTGPEGAGQWAATVCVGSYGTYANAATCGPSSNMRTDTPFTWWLQAQAVVWPTTDVLTRVLEGAGARPLNRDSADVRMINDVKNGTGTHFLDASSVVIPTLQTTTRACALPSNPHEPGTRTLADGTRNTKLEDWLEADPACGARRFEVAPGRR